MSGRAVLYSGIYCTYVYKQNIRINQNTWRITHHSEGSSGLRTSIICSMSSPHWATVRAKWFLASSAAGSAGASLDCPPFGPLACTTPIAAGETSKLRSTQHHPVSVWQSHSKQNMIKRNAYPSSSMGEAHLLVTSSSRRSADAGDCCRLWAGRGRSSRGQA